MRCVILFDAKHVSLVLRLNFEPFFDVLILSWFWGQKLWTYLIEVAKHVCNVNFGRIRLFIQINVWNQLLINFEQESTVIIKSAIDKAWLFFIKIPSLKINLFFEARSKIWSLDYLRWVSSFQLSCKLGKLLHSMLK